MPETITRTRPIKLYSELIRLPSFKERFDYLKLSGQVGEETFGYNRYLNQRFYQTSKEWKDIRRFVIARDLGRDLGVEGYDIHGPVYIHHMNPITLEDIETFSDNLVNPEFLITTCFSTHNALHYGNENLTALSFGERAPDDTCPWKGGDRTDGKYSHVNQEDARYSGRLRAL